MTDQEHTLEQMLERHKLAEQILDIMQDITPWKEDPLQNDQLKEILIGIKHVQDKVKELKRDAENFVLVRNFVSDLYLINQNKKFKENFSDFKSSLNGEINEALNTNLFGS